LCHFLLYIVTRKRSLGCLYFYYRCHAVSAYWADWVYLLQRALAAVVADCAFIGSFCCRLARALCPPLGRVALVFFARKPYKLPGPFFLDLFYTLV